MGSDTRCSDDLLVRRIAGRNDQDALEAEVLERRPNESEMTEMRRIESPTEDRDAHRFSSLPTTSISESLRAPA